MASGENQNEDFTSPTPSIFFDPGTHSASGRLGILQLKRDHLIPTILSSATESEYAEGDVVNTRFGSFPHTTLIGQPWGTQILASVVDTGSRASTSKKRKRDADDDGEGAHKPKLEPKKREVVQAATASSGFVHLVPPSPETWTLCLPHRTQVVYTPDYSYILERLRVRPGDHIIEAGAGSGSFTHAAVRAVFNGYASEKPLANGTQSGNRNYEEAITKKRSKRYGAVYSFEFHKPRAEQLAAEIKEHGLGDSVTITNRDVYEEGFCVGSQDDNRKAPDADAVFLDLPAPWLALKHLTRSPPSAAVVKAVTASSEAPSPSVKEDDPPAQALDSSKPFQSALNPNNAVRICTFSPCIEQVTKTVSAMRSLGWLEIDMVEIMSKRLEVRRERVGLQEEGLRGANASAATVKEAVQRLRDVEGRAKIFHGLQKEKQDEIMRKAEARKRGVKPQTPNGNDRETPKAIKDNIPPSKHDRLERAKKDLENRDLFKEGRLIHRTEPELKTHTSYLVFAVLPRQWSKDDEQKARKKWG
ncbi:tRNA methyltransferase complex GCD14 subunit [Polyplosphaeria fusca]|uniref:tRNA (adenine(58)-N(1))-methyltransferase catalytic subunit TRM61 n=1 Tax=Polyplosphaeria fusca TaxID=682080 RepID=A0A9P4R0M9_9PLEO|nr:tRNA methyltransferase complex GCD14 subunit [Polyplosphaeria fusca]